MNKYLFLGVLILFLASCSEQRFAFRKTIPIDRSIAKEETKKEVRKEKEETPEQASLPAAPADSTVSAQETNKAPEVKKKEKQQISASVFKNIIPFTIDQLSPEPKLSAPPDPGPQKEDLSILTSLLSLIFAVLILMVIFAAVALESPYILILAPLLALGALITGIVALATDSKGKGMAIAGLIIGGIILTLTLLFMAFLWMLEGNSSHP